MERDPLPRSVLVPLTEMAFLWVGLSLQTGMAFEALLSANANLMFEMETSIARSGLPYGGLDVKAILL